jgi:hypothetical protein
MTKAISPLRQPMIDDMKIRNMSPNTQKAGIGCLRHGVLLVLGAPCQLVVLAGPEYGRTIPLADLCSYLKQHQVIRGRKLLGMNPRAFSSNRIWHP